MADNETGYGRRWKKWLAIDAVAGVVVNPIVYLAFFYHAGGGAAVVAHDPPAGFESRVLAGLTEPPRHRGIQPLARRWHWAQDRCSWATAGDRRLAASYQAVLSQGQGSFFVAARSRERGPW